MEKKQLEQMIIMMPIILIGGVFCFSKYLFAPLHQKSNALKTELTDIKKQYEESLSRASRLPKLEQEIVVLNAEIKELEKRLPPTKDIPGLIRMLSQKMDSYNIIWTRLNPGSMNTKEHYIEHTYTIPFQANYHQLAQFLTDLGQQERIFSTKITKLSAQKDSHGHIHAQGELSLVIYTAKN